MARVITHLVVHCSATHPMATVEAIQRYWREVKGWRSPGYARIIKADGTVVQLADDEQITNGVAGHNAHSLHVCYIGGVVPGKKAGDQVPSDTRTDPQKQALRAVLREWVGKYPQAVIWGHRDFPAVVKACPSFDAKAEFRDLGL